MMQVLIVAVMMYVIVVFIHANMLAKKPLANQEAYTKNSHVINP